MDATALLTHPSLPGLQLELGISLSPMDTAHAEPPTSLGISLESCLDLIWISEQQELAMSADRQRWRGRKRALSRVLMCTSLARGWFPCGAPHPTSHPSPAGVRHRGAERSGRSQLPNRKGWVWVWV